MRRSSLAAGLLGVAAAAGCGRSGLSVEVQTDIHPEEGPDDCHCSADAGGPPSSDATIAAPQCIPSITMAIPEAGARGVPTSTAIRATLSCGALPIDKSRVAIHVSVRGREIEGRGEWSPGSNVLEFFHADALALGTTYTVSVSGAEPGARDWEFTTRDGEWRKAERIARGTDLSLALSRAGQGILAFGDDLGDRLNVSAVRFGVEGGFSSSIDTVRVNETAGLHDLSAGVDDSGGALVGWVEYTLVDRMGGYAAWSSRSRAERAWTPPAILGMRANWEELFGAALRADGSGLIVRQDRPAASPARLLADEVNSLAVDEPMTLATTTLTEPARFALHPAGAWVVWTSGRSVLARRTDRSGAWQDPETVGEENASRPGVAAGEDGSAIVSFSEAVAVGKVSHTDGRARRFTPEAGWDAVQPLDTRGDFGSSESLHLQVQLDGYGDALALWITRTTFVVSETPTSTTFGSSHELRSQRFRRASGWADSHVRLDSAEHLAGDGLSEHGLALDPQGNGLAVWTENGNVRASRFSANSGWEPSVLLEGGPPAAPLVAVDGAGRGVAVWSVSGEIHAARFLEPRP